MHTRNETGGFTFVELMIAMAVFAIISTVGIRLVLNGTGAYRQGISVADLEARTSRTLERVVRELSKASSASIVVLSPMVGVQLDFQQSQFLGQTVGNTRAVVGDKYVTDAGPTAFARRKAEPEKRQIGQLTTTQVDLSPFHSIGGKQP